MSVMRTHAHTHARTHAHARTCKHTRTHTHTHTHTNTHIHTHTHRHINPRLNIHIVSLEALSFESSSHQCFASSGSPQATNSEISWALLASACTSSCARASSFPASSSVAVDACKRQLELVGRPFSAHTSAHACAHVRRESSCRPQSTRARSSFAGGFAGVLLAPDRFLFGGARGSA